MFAQPVRAHPAIRADADAPLPWWARWWALPVLARMTPSPALSALARQWPVVAVCFASALGAMYCAPQLALARWALAHPAAVATPDALGQWRQAAFLYGGGLAACLTLFLGSCVQLRRHRTRRSTSVRATAI